MNHTDLAYVRCAVSHIRKNPNTSPSSALSSVVSASFQTERRNLIIHKIAWALENPDEFAAEILHVSVEDARKHDEFHREILEEAFE